MRIILNIPFLLCFSLIIFFYGCKKYDANFSFGLVNNQDIHAIVNNNESILFTTTLAATWAVENATYGTVTADGKFTGGNTDGVAVLVGSCKKDTLLKIYIIIIVNHNAEVLKGMIKGGYVLSFRHVDATLGADSFGPFSSGWWKSCNPMLAQQITFAKGYIDADSIGQTLNLLRGFGVQFDTIRTSEFCRSRQTAEGFKLTNILIKENPILTYNVYDEANRYPNTIALYESLPLNDKNYISVTHAGYSANLPLKPYLNLLEPGDAAVFRKKVGGGLEYVATITLNDWLTMSRR